MTTQELLMKYCSNIPYFIPEYYKYVSHELKCGAIYVKMEYIDGHYRELEPIDLLDYITFVKNLEL